MPAHHCFLLIGQWTLRNNIETFKNHPSPGSLNGPGIVGEMNKIQKTTSAQASPSLDTLKLASGYYHDIKNSQTLAHMGEIQTDLISDFKRRNLDSEDFEYLMDLVAEDRSALAIFPTGGGPR